MVAYNDYLTLSRSLDSAERGQAAHFAASAFISHTGPADEYAALFAAVMGFLDDASVKVRAALAYGLLHSARAPRPVMLALLHDAPIIARAVAQYSPVLLDVDLISCLIEPDSLMERAIVSREKLGTALIRTLLARASAPIVESLLDRDDITVEPGLYVRLIELAQSEPRIRGALLDRKDLPGRVRIVLIEQVKEALSSLRIVKGAIAPKRLSRLLRDTHDTATTQIGENELLNGQTEFVDELIEQGKISVRVMLHALISGQVQFFSTCLARLSNLPQAKIITVLEKGSRPALRALFERCGMGDVSGDLLVSLVGQARQANLADDVAARYFVVTVLIEELIIEFDGMIPDVLCESFAYLNEQNIILARSAARGVMASFAREIAPDRLLPIGQATGQEMLSAA